MTEFALIFIVVVTAAALAYLIYTLIEVRKTVTEANNTLKATGEALNSTLKEAELTLRSVRGVSDGINDIAQGARSLGNRVSDAADGMGVVSAAISGAKTGAKLKALGVKAGVRAGLNVLVKRIIKKGG